MAGFPKEFVFDPSLIYGRTKKYANHQVIPHYVLWAQKCLNFKAFFRESVPNSPAEYYRIRHVNIIYFLEDDTMCVTEPKIDNAGFQQGRLVRRGKISKSKDSEFYHWKDLNVGIDIAIHGIVYHTVSCDNFTSEFLQSQGIDVGDSEIPPPDIYTQNRLERLGVNQAGSQASKQRSSKSLNDSRRRFLEFDGIVLTFEASWNDDFYQLMYFLTDDTIVIKEVPIANNGKDPIKLLLKRMKVPKNWTDLPSTFPSIYLERSDEEVVEYYSPMDFKVGGTVLIFGRCFLLYDCDAFTRKYYSMMLNIEQPAKIVLNNVVPFSAQRQSSVKNSPKNKGDMIGKMFHGSTKLRYLASLVAIHPEDQGRDFVIEYNVGDGKMKINEITKQNSGHRAGCFLAWMLVPKSKSSSDHGNDDDIDYYGLTDFFIGGQINVFNHRFIIKGADRFVLSYVQKNMDKLSDSFVKNIQDYFEHQDDSGIIHKYGTTTKSKEFTEPLLPVKQDSQNTNDNTFPIVQECDKIPRQITWADQVPTVSVSHTVH